MAEESRSVKTAMVWGAGGGIGRSLVENLTTGGWRVVAVTRSPGDIEDLTADIVEADVSDPYEVDLAVTTTGQLVDEVHLWVYAAGDIVAEKVSRLEPEQWSRILNANLTGAFLATHCSLPLLAENAHLFYLGAVSERLRLPGLSAYAAAKAGLEAFVDALSKEQRKHRITIVRPGAVDTAFWDKVPMRLPNNALAPGDVASQILEAYQAAHKGSLDITSN
jgi:NAD(P)-dependent dehydrogenase (short-subunit alcohol dehydrogenase family)